MRRRPSKRARLSRKDLSEPWVVMSPAVYWTFKAAMESHYYLNLNVSAELPTLETM